MTDEQLKARHWDTLIEAKVLKLRLGELEREFDNFTTSWRNAGHTCRRGFDLQTDEKDLIVRNPSRSMEVVDQFPLAHFDIDAIRRLVADIQRAKQELAQVEKDLGINLDGILL